MRSASARSPDSTATPTTPATTAGMTSWGREAGRRRAATAARAARTTSSPFARGCRLRDTTPMAAAASAVTTATVESSTGLSAVPRVCTAHSLTGVGVASMTVEPMASTGEAEGFTKAATRCPAAMPAAAASRPDTAYVRRVVLASELIASIRTRRGSRMGHARPGGVPTRQVPWDP